QINHSFRFQSHTLEKMLSNLVQQSQDFVNIGRKDQQNMLCVLRLRRNIYPLYYLRQSGVYKFFPKIQLLLKLDEAFSIFINHKLAIYYFFNFRLNFKQKKENYDKINFDIY